MTFWQPNNLVCDKPAVDIRSAGADGVLVFLFNLAASDRLCHKITHNIQSRREYHEVSQLSLFVK